MIQFRKHIVFSIVSLLLCASSAHAQSLDYQTTPPNDDEKVAVIQTSLGTMKAKLFPAEAPQTVENFEKLATEKFYQDLRFHRVIPNFMIQTGDPLSSDSDPANDGTGGPGYQFEDEFSDALHNIRGSLSMANSGANTNGSQFFINQVNNPDLDAKHTVFGQVYEGLDILDAIANVATDEKDRPLNDVVLEDVIITTAGADIAQIDTSDSDSTRVIGPGVFWKTAFKVLLWIIGIALLILIILSVIVRRKMPKPRTTFSEPKPNRKKRHKNFGKNKRK